MTLAAKMKGQIKETTGKIAGDTGLETQGTFEKGVADVEEAVGGAFDYITEVVGAGINVVTNAINVYKNATKSLSKLF
jgi:uncharacterized protein YjbJ (UPF0337 family)